MEFIGLLAPPAFVFALAALSQAQSLRKELLKVQEELAEIRSKLASEA